MNFSNPIRVAIADDSAVFRAALRSFLLNEEDIDVVGEAADGAEALRLVEEIAPDILLLDMRMPRMSGVEVLRQLQTAPSTTRIVVLSAHSDPKLVQSALQHGAHGYIRKDEGPLTLTSTIRQLMHSQLH